MISLRPDPTFVTDYPTTASLLPYYCLTAILVLPYYYHTAAQLPRYYRYCSYAFDANERGQVPFTADGGCVVTL